MLSTAIIIFRETLEIAMIMGVVLAATRGLPGRMAWIAGGFMAGSMGAGLVAVFAQTIAASLAGLGQEFFNAGILFTAALFIGWTAVWIRKNARMVTAHLKQVGQDVREGKLPFYSLAAIIGLSMLREGSEIVLFIYGMALSGQSGASIVMGSGIGVLLGLVVGTLFYYGLLKIPARYTLSVTSWLLMLLVAGLASQGVGYLSAAGYFSGLSHHLWDSSWLLAEDSIVGKSLHSLIGYTARPTEIQGIVYLATLLGLFFAIGIISRDAKHKLAAAVILVGIFAFAAAPALALDEIYSPNVEEGEIAVEYSASRTFDPDAAKNNAQEHQLALEYAVNNRWIMETNINFAKDPDQNLKLDHAELESRFQFFEQGENWVDSGLLLAYGFAAQSAQPDTLEVKLLLQKDFGRITSTANIGFSEDLGRYAASGGPDYVVLWNTRYRYSEELQPGIELQSDLGQSDALGQFDKQAHYLGPALYGRLFDRVKYQAAWLFGASNAAAQSAARALVEYEMHF